MQSKTDQGVVKLCLSSQFADVDVFHAIVEDLDRHTAKMGKGVDVTVQKGGQITAFNELPIDPARIAQDHGKQI